MSSCVDSVSTAINEASKSFSNEWVIDKRRNAVLMEYCVAIDDLIEELGCDFFKAYVDMTTMEVNIILEMSDFVVRSPHDVFYAISDRAISVSFVSGPKDDDVFVSFLFPSIWIRNRRVGK